MAFWLALAGAATAAWHDCSAAEGIANPQLTFQNARRLSFGFSLPPPRRFPPLFLLSKVFGMEEIDWILRMRGSSSSFQSKEFWSGLQILLSSAIISKNCVSKGTQRLRSEMI